MATFHQQGTSFSFSIEPPKSAWDGHWIRTRIAVDNQFIHYEELDERMSYAEMNELLFTIARLMAGAFHRDYGLSTEKLGLAFDFYPYVEEGKEISREQRRREDCVMAVRLLFKDENGKFLSGIFTLLLRREELKTLWTELTEALERYYPISEPSDGEYLFVAVSPLGYRGCKYWYLDPSKTARKGDYVWAKMGRHDLEQIVYVDEARFFDRDFPYEPSRVKKILRKASKEEIASL